MTNKLIKPFHRRDSSTESKAKPIAFPSSDDDDDVLLHRKPSLLKRAGSTLKHLPRSVSFSSPKRRRNSGHSQQPSEASVSSGELSPSKSKLKDDSLHRSRRVSLLHIPTFLRRRASSLHSGSSSAEDVSLKGPSSPSQSDSVDQQGPPGLSAQAVPPAEEEPLPSPTPSSSPAHSPSSSPLPSSQPSESQPVLPPPTPTTSTTPPLSVSVSDSVPVPFSESSTSHLHDIDLDLDIDDDYSSTSVSDSSSSCSEDDSSASLPSSSEERLARQPPRSISIALGNMGTFVRPIPIAFYLTWWLSPVRGHWYR